ncbi:hypothetical protein Glove_259g20 [Diversispora epigaea]|uniref:DUF6570 domain-containing protein n=1 Tax=Diversispora epigaea TaxID=1348612 RepID=A0A397I6K9_9GLOM|nr:hypothetical protein Glove_259g20 [Diversispora epigaea]
MILSQNQCKRREIQHTKKQKICIEKDIQAIEAQVLLRVLELNNEFDLLKERYANWPQPVNRIIANNALAEFRNNISCNSLRELTCAPFFEIDFVYGHPCIDKSGYKIFNCKQSLKAGAGNTPIFSLANMWIGTTPQCLQGLTIPEQLLISTGYICINLIQLNNRRHTHYKLKGHVITFIQELTSLSKILTLPVYQLCDHLKVVFVRDGQLKKVLCIRKNKVAVALKWLINHNILYKNVKLDKTALESLPENGVPTALLETTIMININPEK